MRLRLDNGEGSVLLLYYEYKLYGAITVSEMVPAYLNRRYST